MDGGKDDDKAGSSGDDDKINYKVIIMNPGVK